MTLPDSLPTKGTANEDDSQINGCSSRNKRRNVSCTIGG
jgi:hypothetical protein